MDMKKMFAGAVATMFVMACFGYGNSDKDAQGHSFDDPTYYVMTASSSGFDGGASLYDDGSHWADSLAPTGDKDYYVANNHYIYAPPNATYKDGGAKAQYNQTFQGRSLTLGAWSQGLRLEGNGASKTAYTINFPDLRMRPLSKIYCWSNINTGAIKGNLTILSEDANYPALIIGPKADDAQNTPDHVSGLNIFSNIIGGNSAQLCVTGFYETNADPAKNFTNGTYQCFIELLGDNSGYSGTVKIGSNALVTFAGGFPNGNVVVDGTTYSALNKQNLTAPWTTAIGANSSVSPTFNSLTLADGVRIDCDTLVTNETHFTVLSSYTQQGKVKLDFRGVALDGTREEYLLMRFASGGAINLQNFDVENVTLGAFQLDYVNNELKLVNVGGEPMPVGAVTMVAQDTRTGNNGANFAFYGSNTNGVVGAWWSDGLAPHSDADYYVGDGLFLQTDVSWALVRNAGRQTYKLDGQGNWNGSSWTTLNPLSKFMGRSLTIGDGGAFNAGCYKNNLTTVVNFPLIIEDLQMQGGSQFRITQQTGNLGPSWVDAQTTITIGGKRSNPVEIWCGQKYNNAENYAAFLFYNCFAGSGCARLSGGGKNETSTVPMHYYNFYGNNDAFTGTMLVGGSNAIDTRGNLIIRLGASGLRNAALVFDDAEPVLGVAENATGAYIPVKDLTLAGNMIAADTIVTNNASFGFVVSGAFAASGVTTFDFANLNIPVPSVKLIAIPSAGSFDLANFALANAPVGYALEVVTIGANKVLCAVDPNFVCTLYAADMPDDGVHNLMITAGEVGETIDMAKYAFGGDVDTGKYRFIKKTSGGVETLYIENMACQVKTAYDVYQSNSDYQGRKTFDAGDNSPTQSFTFGDDSGWGHWSNGLAPSAGKSYITPDWMALHINTNGVHVFAGDSLTIGGTAATRHETLFRVDAKTDVTGDFRFMNGVQFFSAGGAVADLDEDSANTILRGEFRVMSPANDPMIIRYNADSTKAGSMRHCVIKSRLSGIAGAGIRFWNRNADAGATQSYLSTLYVDFVGDNADYDGTIFCETQSVIRVGSSGMPRGVIDLVHSTSAFVQTASTPIAVRKLKLAAGSTVKLNGAGLSVTELEMPGSGKPVIDLSGVPNSLLESTLISVPSSTGFSLANFDVVYGSVDAAGLSVETADGITRLKYEKPVAGTMLLFK